MINEDTVIKVTGNSIYDKFNFTPSYKIRERVCNQIKESNLFKPLGKSRIDGYELYRLNELTLRQIKIDKITNNNELFNRLTKLMDDIKDDINYVTLMYDDEEIIII